MSVFFHWSQHFGMLIVALNLVAPSNAFVFTVKVWYTAGDGEALAFVFG